ncbi:MAG: hypothetical protein J5974_06645 [Pyramidobacter sp.]|nr:hypothetical protein [Pyramidobacter sp.]
MRPFYYSTKEEKEAALYREIEQFERFEEIGLIDFLQRQLAINERRNKAYERGGYAACFECDSELRKLRTDYQASKAKKQELEARLARLVAEKGKEADSGAGVRVIRRPVRIRFRARRVRRAGRHVSRSFVTAGIDSGGGGDDGGGDSDGQSDCNRVALSACGKAQFIMVSARFGGLSLNDRINTIATRKRALPAQERGARGGGRFFIPLWRWAA